MTHITAVAVYCGARAGADPKYADAAYRFGQAMASRDIRLIFGGGSVGLMGTVANGVLDAGGEAIGVITSMLVRREVANLRLTTLEVVESMHERKQRMFELADGFVALPGGVGTLDETIEVITWRLLGLHDKPIVIADQDGYWKPLAALIQHTIAEGFAAPDLPDLYSVVSDFDAILPTLERARRPTIPAQPERT